MDTSEALQVFGSSFQVTYYNGSDYVSTTATYTNGTRTLQNAVGDYPSGAECLQYTAPVVNLSHNPEYITLDIRPQYSIFNTTQLHTAIMVYCTQNAAVPPYQTPDWRWTVNGNESIFYGVLDSNDIIDTVYVASDRCIYIPVDLSQQATFQANSVRVTFVAPVSVYNNNLYIYLAPPYLSNDAFGESGTGSQTTTTSSSSSGGGEVDLEETNGLLDGILDAISGLGNMILGLFIPSQEFLEDWIDAMKEMLEDHLGGIYEAVEEIVDMFDSITGVSATNSFHVDAVNIPLAGTNLTLGNWDVPLKTQAIPQIAYDALAYIIDFLVSAAFLNMCKRKLEIFLNPDSEKV